MPECHEKYETTERDCARELLNRFKHVIGKSKIDNTKRVSVISELAEIINVGPGDEIEYSMNGGEIILKKITTTYKGFNIEHDLIKERMYDYLAMKYIETGKNRFEGNIDDQPTYEEAREDYLRMINNRNKSL